MTKEEWRIVMKEKLQNMTFDIFKQNCATIYARLFNEAIWKKANTIGITLSIDREVETWPIIEHAWEMDKRVAVPKSIPHLHELTFYKIHSFSQIEEGYAGIMEPNPQQTSQVNHDEIDLLFVPGLVFDQDGFRIGYGGGYYDRYLQHFHHETISLAFECQLVEHIPRNPYDMPVNRIITENNVVEVTEKEKGENG